MSGTRGVRQATVASGKMIKCQKLPVSRIPCNVRVLKVSGPCGNIVFQTERRARLLRTYFGCNVYQNTVL